MSELQDLMKEAGKAAEAFRAKAAENSELLRAGTLTEAAMKEQMRLSSEALRLGNEVVRRLQAGEQP
jgi:hypothetical protein